MCTMSADVVEGGVLASMPAPTSRVALPKLRAWRAHRLLTQQQLADAAGVSAATVTRADAGASVSVLTATRLARALGVSVQVLREEEPPST